MPVRSPYPPPPLPPAPLPPCSYYRVIQQYMIDCENLWELLGKQTAIVDPPGAKDLVVKAGGGPGASPASEPEVQS